MRKAIIHHREKNAEEDRRKTGTKEPPLRITRYLCIGMHI
jgi:hypothetical protein